MYVDGSVMAQELAQRKKATEDIKKELVIAAKAGPPKRDVRMKRDVQAGHGVHDAYQKMKSRRRADQHRRDGAAARAAQHLDNEEKWHAAHADQVMMSRKIDERGQIYTRKELTDFQDEPEPELKVQQRSWAKKPEPEARKKKKRQIWRDKLKQRKVQASAAGADLADVVPGANVVASLDSSESPGDLMSFAEADVWPTKYEYDRFDLVMDSGACRSALPLKLAASTPLEPMEPMDSITCRTATGETLAPEGKKSLTCEFQQGSPKRLSFLSMDVTRPLGSVSQMVGNGCRVVFDSDASGGSYLEHKTTGDKHRIFLRNGVYVLPMWARRHVDEETSWEQQPGELGSLGGVSLRLKTRAGARVHLPVFSRQAQP